MAEPSSETARPVGGPSGGRDQRRLRNYLINMKFQLPWVLGAAAVVAMVFGTFATFALWQGDATAPSAGIGPLARAGDAVVTPDLFKGSDATIFWTLFGAGGGLLALVIVVGIVMTHKVAGPMHGLVRAFGSIRSGNYLAVHGFRRGDAFQEVGDELVVTSRALFDRERAELGVLESVRAKGLTQQSLAELDELIAQKRARVG
jgi:hypothetical protein